MNCAVYRIMRICLRVTMLLYFLAQRRHEARDWILARSWVVSKPTSVPISKRCDRTNCAQHVSALYTHWRQCRRYKLRRECDISSVSYVRACSKFKMCCYFIWTTYTLEYRCLLLILFKGILWDLFIFTLEQIIVLKRIKSKQRYSNV